MNEVQIKWESRTWKGDQEGFFLSAQLLSQVVMELVQLHSTGLWKLSGSGEGIFLPREREGRGERGERGEKESACAHMCWQNSALVA